MKENPSSAQARITGSPMAYRVWTQAIHRDQQRVSLGGTCWCPRLRANTEGAAVGWLGKRRTRPRGARGSPRPPSSRTLRSDVLARRWQLEFCAPQVCRPIISPRPRSILLPSPRPALPGACYSSKVIHPRRSLRLSCKSGSCYGFQDLAELTRSLRVLYQRHPGA